MISWKEKYKKGPVDLQSISKIFVLPELKIYRDKRECSSIRAVIQSNEPFSRL